MIEETFFCVCVFSDTPFSHRIHTINHHTGGEEPRLDLEFAYDDADPPLPENAKVRAQDFGNESGP